MSFCFGSSVELGVAAPPLPPMSVCYTRTITLSSSSDRPPPSTASIVQLHCPFMYLDHPTPSLSTSSLPFFHFSTDHTFLGDSLLVFLFPNVRLPSPPLHPAPTAAAPICSCYCYCGCCCCRHRPKMRTESNRNSVEFMKSNEDQNPPHSSHLLFLYIVV